MIIHRLGGRSLLEMARLFTITSLLFLFLCTIPLVTAQSGNCSGPQNACQKVNNSLVPCNGQFTPPPNYEDHGTYGVTPSLAACECNIDYYNTLVACVQCYNNGQNNIVVDSLSTYKSDCKTAGQVFSDVSTTATASKPSSTSTPLVSSSVSHKVAICVAVGCLFIAIGAAIAVWRHRKKKKNKERAQTVAFAIATEGTNGNSGAANVTNMAQTNVPGTANDAAFIVPPNPISTPPPPYSVQKPTAIPPTQAQPPFRLAPEVYDPYLANASRYSTTDSQNGIRTSTYSPHDSLRSWNGMSVYSSDSQMPLPGNGMSIAGASAYSPHSSWNGTSAYSTSNSQMPTHGMPTHGMPVYDPKSMLGTPTREYPRQ